MTDEFEFELDLDLEVDLDNYLLHPQPQHHLRIVHAFMQADRKIEHVCEEIVPIENSTLLQEKLIWCIKRQQQRQREQCKMHFKLRSMFLYNMDMQPADVQDFLKSKNSNHQFLVPISALDNITIQPSIPMFARLTALHIFYEATERSHHSHDHSHSKKKVIHIQDIRKQKHKHTRTRTRTRTCNKDTNKTA